MPASSPEVPVRAMIIWRLRGVFLLLGALSAGWTVRIPAVKFKLDLSDTQLGLEVLGWGLSSILAMHFSAHPIRRFGTHRLLMFAVPGVAVALVPVGLAGNFGFLILGGILFGLCYGLAEVSATTATTAIEAAADRPLVGSMHASWSVGALAGGLLGAGGAALGVSFTGAMTIMAGIGVAAAIALVNFPTPRHVPEPMSSNQPRRLPRTILLLAVISGCVLLAEGSIADWSAVYLVSFAGTPQAIAALAYPLTEAVVIGARLLADRVSRPDRVRLIIVGATTAGGAGFVVVSLAPNVAVAVTGFVFVGATLGVVAPLTLSAAGRAGPELRAAAVGRVSTFGYGGFLVGPVAIGLASDAWSLGSAYLICCVASAGAVISALFIRGST